MSGGTQMEGGQLLKCGDGEFDKSIQEMSLKKLLDTISMVQKEMGREQTSFNSLSAQMATLNKNSRQYKQISKEMNTSQTRLTMLMNRSMKCFQQQGNQHIKSPAPVPPGVQRHNSNVEPKEGGSGTSVQRRHSSKVSATEGEVIKGGFDTPTQNTGPKKPVILQPIVNTSRLPGMGVASSKSSNGVSDTTSVSSISVKSDSKTTTHSVVVTSTASAPVSSLTNGTSSTSKSSSTRAVTSAINTVPVSSSSDGSVKRTSILNFGVKNTVQNLERKSVINVSTSQVVTNGTAARSTTSGAVVKPGGVKGQTVVSAASTVSKPVVSSVVTKPATTGGVTKPVTTGGVTKPATTGGVTKPATTEGVTKPVTTGGVTKPATTGGVTKPATTGGVTKPVTTGGVTKPATTGGVTKPATTGGVTKTVSGGVVTKSVTSSVTVSSQATNKIPDPPVAPMLKKVAQPSKYSRPPINEPVDPRTQMLNEIRSFKRPADAPKVEPIRKPQATEVKLDIMQGKPAQQQKVVQATLPQEKVVPVSVPQQKSAPFSIPQQKVMPLSVPQQIVVPATVKQQTIAPVSIKTISTEKLKQPEKNEEETVILESKSSGDQTVRAEPIKALDSMVIEDKQPRVTQLTAKYTDDGVEQTQAPPKAQTTTDDEAESDEDRPEEKFVSSVTFTHKPLKPTEIVKPKTKAPAPSPAVSSALPPASVPMPAKQGKSSVV